MKSFRDRLVELWLSMWHHRVQVVLMLAALFAALKVSGWPERALALSRLDFGWWQWLDPMLGIATLAVALGVWFIEAREAWEDSLEKRLYVVFAHHGRPVLRCDHAPLFGESDIRQFAMQIGAQMTGARLLNFAVDIQRFPPTIERDGGQRFKRWVVVFSLDSLKPIQWKDPVRDIEEKALGDQVIALSRAGRFRYWPRAKRPEAGDKELKDQAEWLSLPSLPWAPADGGVGATSRAESPAVTGPPTTTNA